MWRLSTPLFVMDRALMHLEEARLRIKMAHIWMKALDCNIWHFCVSLQTKINSTTCIYYQDSSTVQTCGVRHSSLRWCLRCIVWIPYTVHVTNDKVTHRTCQPPATLLITIRQLHLFGHIAQANPSQDHHMLSEQPQPPVTRLATPRETLLTSSSTTSASSERTSISSGINSWRQLCRAEDVPPDDDDDDAYLVYLYHYQPFLPTGCVKCCRFLPSAFNKSSDVAEMATQCCRTGILKRWSGPVFVKIRREVHVHGC